MIIKQDNLFLYYIYFYIFITPWHFSNSQPAILSVILFIWGIIKFNNELLNIIKNYSKFLPLTLLFLFIGYIYTSTLWSDSLLDGLDHVNTFNKYYFIIIPILLVSLNRASAITATKILIVSFSIYSLYSILIYSSILSIESSSVLNPKGHLRYSIATQYMVISFFASSFFYYYSTIKIEKILFVLMALLSFFALFINNSRTSQIAFLAIIIIFAILFFKRYVLNYKILIIIIIINISAIYVLYKNAKLDRYINFYNETHKVISSGQYTGSFGTRLFFNKAGIEIFKHNIFFGTGPKDNRLQLQEMQKNNSNYKGDDDKGRVINHFHSEHLDILTAYGIIGYLLIVSSIILLIYKLRKQSEYFYISLGVFLTLLFVSFANKTLSLIPLNVVYIIFFILLAIIAHDKNQNTEQGCKV